MEIRILMHILPCIRAVILPREISSNGKLMTGGIRLTYMGYEGLSEVLVSDLLQKSTCPFPFVGV